MTICIAAISENKRILAVTDKMITIENPIRTTFEISDNNKIAQLTDKTMALFAGDVIQANEILKKAKTGIGNPTGQVKVFDIANKVRDAFSAHWESVVSNYLFTRYRLNLEDFTKNQGSFDADLIKQVNELISKFQINVNIIIAGVDSSPRIFAIDNAMSVVEQTPIGYACIGSGEIHATLSLIESEYTRSLEKSEAMYALLEAKKRAEYDPGVGEHCDIAIIDASFKQCDTGKVDEILQIFEKSRDNIKKTKQKTYEELKAVKNV